MGNGIKILLTAWLAVLFAAIFFLFWHNEYKYSLPTPLPINYHKVNIGENINLKGKLKAVKNRPLFIHFFNPSCPCSRFNVPQIESLVKKYGDKISFAIVVISNDTSYTEEDIQDKFDLTIPILFDKSIATSCGVFSTPQAVILDKNHNLYYRGNYNKNRYCTDTKSNFAQMALDSLLNNNQKPSFDSLALKAYGCSLPNCKK
jgi:thiol-disulfide isomerase/thioredoxin